MDTKSKEITQMEKKNKVFIATSLDGYIADKNGELDWLHSVPNPDHIDMGYEAFTSNIDAILMGRTTFETVCGFDEGWPYQKPVFVLSNTMTDIPKEFEDKAHLVKGQLKEVIHSINNKGYNRLYIDGGSTIRSFLNADMIDEMIITIIPILLGGGSPLFSESLKRLEFKCTDTKIFLGEVVQNHYKRKR